MLREEEENECLYVLNLDGTTVVEERTGKQFDDLEEFDLDQYLNGLFVGNEEVE